LEQVIAVQAGQAGLDVAPMSRAPWAASCHGSNPPHIWRLGSVGQLLPNDACGICGRFFPALKVAPFAAEDLRFHQFIEHAIDVLGKAAEELHRKVALVGNLASPRTLAAGAAPERRG